MSAGAKKKATVARATTPHGEYRSYAKHKPSGVDWFGEMPEGWSTYRISDLSKYGGKTFTDGDWIESPYITDDGIRLLQTGNIGIGFFKEQGYRFISEDTFKELNCTEITPGDILICRLADPVGRACIAPFLDSRMITSVDVTILKPRDEFYNKYVVYVLSSNQYLSYLSMLCRGGTRDRVSRSMLGQIRIVLPSIFDQRVITNFLDRETTRIDTLVDKNRSLIERLKEKRLVLISRTVTRGLPPEEARPAGFDPNPKLKDSGVEWLGKIPAHWRATSIGYIASKTGSGKTPRGGSETYLSEGILLIRSQNVHDTGLRLNDVVYIDESVDNEMETTRVSPGDVLLNITGASLGRCSIAPSNLGPANVNQHVCIIRADSTAAYPGYIQRTLISNSTKGQIFSFENGSSREGLNFQQVRNLRIALPPIIEQRAIASYLDRETAKIDELIAKVETAIERLKEYRSALISAVVTGKIDVREESA
jgi:type I restriction enzyme, S subunit